MNVQLIVCHPCVDSFNHAIAHRLENALYATGHSVVFHDLYRERFDPVLPYEEIIGGFRSAGAGIRAGLTSVGCSRHRTP